MFYRLGYWIFQGGSAPETDDGSSGSGGGFDVLRADNASFLLLANGTSKLGRP